jgi:glycosyltransferase 2 family protein
MNGSRAALRSMRNVLIAGVLAGLLYFALRDAPLRDIWTVLGGLHYWQIAVLLLIDMLIYALITARWWLIIRAENKHVGYLPLIGIRLAAFGISYFTVGPQVGGEPLQILHLRSHGLSYTRATASVFLDKLLEFLANFLLLGFGLLALAQAGLLSGSGAPALPAWLAVGALLLWPLTHILLLYHGIYPLSILARLLPFQKLRRFVAACERMAGDFCRRHLISLLSATAFSVLAAVGTVSEYFLMTSFLHIHLNFWQTAAAWTAGWLSFLVPLPAGLGALEASQVFTFGFFGIAAATAISLVLLVRGRDLLLGGLGLILAGHRISIKKN